MNVNLQQEKQTILDAFDRTQDVIWATPPEISGYSGVSLENVLRILYNSREFIRNPERGSDGLPVFTTRKVYKERMPFWYKFLDFLRGDYA